MEAVEEQLHQSSADVIKANVSSEEPVPALESSLCYTSNGVGDGEPSLDAPHPVGAVYYVAAPLPTEPHLLQGVAESTHPAVGAAGDYNMNETSVAPETAVSQQTEDMLVMETTAAVEHLLEDEKSAGVIVEEGIVVTEEIPCHESEVTPEETAHVTGNVDEPDGKVAFKTEILVEQNDNDIVNDSDYVEEVQIDNSNNILNELGQGIELSEALRSSDTVENAENNNCAYRGEMFNKEELLDILEGNDASTSGNEDGSPGSKKIIEAQIAMKQLKRLTESRRKPKDRPNSSTTNRKPRSKKPDNKNVDATSENEKEEQVKEVNIEDSETSKTEEHDISVDSKDNESIVNSLVKDWEDDEPPEADSGNGPEEANGLLKATEELIQSQEEVVHEETVSITPEEKPKSQETEANKSGDETQTRRLGRVIKKKVPFDPDNPDTFTKGKAVSKIKEAQVEKEPPLKKVKSETAVRAKSKSPVAKSPWKKPTPKNSNKQNKRLTEVDKLLMDEGAVNMIYQLTPEATKGRKNMKTKAEFIKKLQSSTPEGKEMKFRERKKESKSEEIEAKKILDGKPRTSLSSSVKSPACEDLESHSAEDSIIFRRHSSSSYSSSCMSPRRLSDGDTGASQNAARPPHQNDGPTNPSTPNESAEPAKDIFMADTSTETINKDDCLSIKEKLNTKLSQVLNKRKRENNKTEKPPKQKKLSKAQLDKSSTLKAGQVDIKHISLTFEKGVAEICFKDISSSVEMFKELDYALQIIDNIKDTCVTVLISECGTLCSRIDLDPLLENNMEKRTNKAYELAESIRVALSTLWRHSKLVVSGVWGQCSGVAPALLALSDVALASPAATLALAARPPVPAAAALAASSRQVSQSLVTELVVFERCISGEEARAGGLVDRVSWPLGVAELRTASRQLVAKPPQGTLLKKQLLNLRKTELESTFMSSLERERDSLVEYWISVEGQEAIRASVENALNQ